MIVRAKVFVRFEALTSMAGPIVLTTLVKLPNGVENLVVVCVHPRRFGARLVTLLAISLQWLITQNRPWVLRSLVFRSITLTRTRLDILILVALFLKIRTPRLATGPLATWIIELTVVVTTMLAFRTLLPNA